jgi:hypothetical protein
VRVEELGAPHTAPRFTHVVLRRGQELPLLDVVAVAGKATRVLRVTLVYPADATPPQLLTVERLAERAQRPPVRAS